MKAVSFLALMFLTAFAQAEDRKITGTFESVPIDALVGFPDSVKNKELAEKRHALAEKTRQTLVITEKDISLETALGPKIQMTYAIQGEFALGKTMLGQTEMFYPIYIKDPDTLFLMGQKFVRKKEDGK